MSKLISIIIPVYNGTDTIHRCLKSVLNQTIGLDKTEILLVDDCSTDDSFSILKDYESRFPDSVKVLQTPKNLRVGGARNLGIKHATGDYLGFVDADDWIEPFMYEHMLEKALSYDCDVVNCRSFRDAEFALSEDVVRTDREDMGIVISNNTERSDFIVSNIIGTCLAFHIYKRTMITEHSILSPEGLAYEDNVFDPMVYLYANRVYLLEERLYHYYINPDSIVLSLDKPYHNDFFEVGRIRYEEYVKRDAFKNYKDAVSFDYLMGFYVSGLKILSLRFSTPQIEGFKHLRRDTLERIPDALSNPYIQTHTTELQRMQIAMLGANMSDEDIKEFLSIVKQSYMGS